MKTNIKIFASIFIVILWWIQTLTHVSAWFWTSTFISDTQDIPKIHGGQRTLYAHEDYVSNPFSNSTIIQNQLNGQTTSFSVDGRIFNASHTLYHRTNTMMPWVIESPGIRSRIQYLEDTFTSQGWIALPKQSVRTRKHYEVNFNFDTTPPTWGDLRLYNDAEGTSIFNYEGWWVNTPKYYTLYCSDPETGCECRENDSQCELYDNKVRLVPKLIGHKSTPSATFTNRVDLSSTVEVPLPGWKELLYDQTRPRTWMFFWESLFWEERYEFDTRDPWNRKYLFDEYGNILDENDPLGRMHYELKNQISFLANDTTNLYVILEDRTLNASANWVSWISWYSIKLEKEDADEPNTYEEIFSESESFDPFNPDGARTDADRKIISLDDVDFFQQTWKYRLTTDTFDFAWNNTKIISYFTVYPNYPDEAKSTIRVTEKNTFDDTILADNKSYFEYEVSLKDTYWNPIFNRELQNISQDIQEYNGGKTLYLDMISKTWESAFRIVHPEPLSTNSSWDFTFDLYSYTPWSFTQRFKLEYNLWDDAYKNISSTESLYLWQNIGYEENQFFAPLSWSISLNNEAPQLWKEQEYKISIFNPSNFSFSNAWLEISVNTLDFLTPHVFRTLTIPDNSFTTWKRDITFSWSISITQESASLTVPQLQVDNLPVFYRFSGKNVRYILPRLESNFCEIDSITTLGVSVVWNIQWSGRWSITGQSENISDISVTESRSEIRRNALNALRGRNWNGDIVNGIRYVSGQNVTLTWNQDYETLIVRNGNVFISGNITENLWIIVIKDSWYNLTRDYTTSWNIYIANTVSQIHALIYADGVVRSAKINWEKYSDSELSESLLVKWALFTRNTIGWAVWVENDYLLPWGEKTQDFSLAEMYDLNFLRKTNLCNPPHYSLRIEYNQEMITNPPAWF